MFLVMKLALYDFGDSILPFARCLVVVNFVRLLFPRDDVLRVGVKILFGWMGDKS